MKGRELARESLYAGDDEEDDEEELAEGAGAGEAQDADPGEPPQDRQP